MSGNGRETPCLVQKTAGRLMIVLMDLLVIKAERLPGPLLPKVWVFLVHAQPIHCWNKTEIDVEELKALLSEAPKTPSFPS